MEKHKRHWSFIVTDKKYLYPLVVIILFIGIIFSMIFNDPNHMNRIGGFVIGIGVCMSMRHTFREGIQRTHSMNDELPVIPETNQLNANFFNKKVFGTGDAVLQIHGFIIVVFGSIIGSYGDILYEIIISLLKKI